jgi:hypothetical protein
VTATAIACSKTDGAKDAKRFDVTVWIDPKGTVPPADFVVSTTTAHPPIEFVERQGLKIGYIGVPAQGDPTEIMEHNVLEVHRTKADAAIFVTTRCLSDLQPVFKKNLLPFWIVALVVGAQCDGGYDPQIAAAGQVAIGSASRVRITFDRSTKVFLRVEPVP